MVFHYASSSPWPMLPALHDWISNTDEFPDGSFHLKPFRLELFEPWGIDVTLLNLFKDPTQYKVFCCTHNHFSVLLSSCDASRFGVLLCAQIKLISGILKDFPQRRFVLVGDSSEKDPEVLTCCWNDS